MSKGGNLKGYNVEAAKRYAAQIIVHLEKHEQEQQEPTPYTIGQVIAEAADTQQAVADALGVSLRTVTYWAHRDRDPNWKQFLHICELAGVSPAQVKRDS